MAGAMPTSPLWTTARYPDALPYMVQSHCFNWCVPTPPCELFHFPQPCVCTVSAPMPPGTMPEANPRNGA